MRWLLTLVFAFIVFNGLRGWLAKIGLGRLPGDFAFRVRGREWYFPFGSTVLLSLIGWALARWI
jgi:Protein of unknown function (DUF2905)